jgi:hypothetical protein
MVIADILDRNKKSGPYFRNATRNQNVKKEKTYPEQ